MLNIYRIFSSAHTNSVRIRRNSTSSERRNSINMINNNNNNHNNNHLGEGLHRSPSLWSRLSSVSNMLPVHREEGRAAGVTLMIVMLVTVTWTPHVTMIMIRVLGHQTPAWLHSLCSAVMCLYSSISPVFFCLRQVVTMSEILGYIPPCLQRILPQLNCRWKWVVNVITIYQTNCVTVLYLLWSQVWKSSE